MIDRTVALLPRGRTLTDAAWSARHRGILALLWAHALGLPLVSLATGAGIGHSAAHGAALAGFALIATVLSSRLTRAITASCGLLTASALLVHATHGLTEAHFHFFVMVSVITLYEDWRTFLLAFGYVVAHHGIVGTLMPAEVFDHAGATAAPLKWAGIHGGFVLAAGIANIAAWRANEAVTEQRTGHARRRADEADRRLAALVQSTDDAVIGKTPDGIVTSWNLGAERMFGVDAASMIGRSILGIVPTDLWEEERGLMAQVVREGRLDHYETRRLRADGTVLDVSLTLSLVCDGGDGGEPGLVGIARDISERTDLDRERRAHAERMQRLALEDDLTGLGNFRAFHTALDREIARVTRDGGELSVVLLDLDGFKGVNDRHGHAEGDRVLRLVAEQLHASARGSDVPCRLGGDEFALILPATGRAGATVVADRVRAGVCAARPDVDVSFGVAVWPDDAGDKDELVMHADAGMYAAKALRPARGPRAGEDERPPGAAGADADEAVRRLLELARAHLGMDVALVGEFDRGDEVMREVVGEVEAFGLAVGDRIPLADSYCQRVVDGRLTNIVRDAAADERVRDLAITSEAGIGAYLGVPLAVPGGATFGMLCCLRKGADASLDERDVKFLEVVAGIAAREIERGRVERLAERLGDDTARIDAAATPPSAAAGTRSF